MAAMVAAVLFVAAVAAVTVPGRRLANAPLRLKIPRIRRRTERGAPVPVGAILVEVSARLRAGVAIDAAWQQTLTGQRDVPHQLRALAGQPAGAPAWQRKKEENTPRTQAVAGAIAAANVAEYLGAPLADVLDSCAQGLAEAEESASARQTALAAPRATAKLLLWLPLVGLIMGAAVGADPAVLVDGGWGTASLVAGVLLMIIGHRWTAILVGYATRAGT